MCVCVCACVLTHYTAQEPRRCCLDSRYLHHTSIAPGYNDCSCRQTPQLGTEGVVCKMGWLWKEMQQTLWREKKVSGKSCNQGHEGPRLVKRM